MATLEELIGDGGTLNYSMPTTGTPSLTPPGVGETEGSPNQGNPSFSDRFMGNMRFSANMMAGVLSGKLRNPGTPGLRDALDAGAEGDKGMARSSMMAQGAMFGAAPLVAGAADTLERGNLFDNIGARQAQMQQVRENAGGVGTALEVAGGIATGGAIASAGKRVIGKIAGDSNRLMQMLANNPAARIGTTATGAGAGAGVYEVLDSGDLDAVPSAIALGTIGGGGVAVIGEYLPYFLKLATSGGQGSQAQAENMLRQLRELNPDLFAELTKDGRYNAQALAARAEGLGPDETLYDAFPEFRHVAGDVLKSGNKGEVRDQIIDLVNLVKIRSNVELPEFKSVIQETIASPDIRTIEDVQRNAKAAYEAVRPQYDEALSKARGIGVKREALIDGVNKVFQGAPAGPAVTRLKRRMLNMFQGQATFNAGDLLNLRKEMDAVFQAANRGQNKLNRNTVSRYGYPVRQQLRDVLYQVAPDLKALDQQYASTTEAVDLYKDGYAAIRANRPSNIAYAVADMKDSAPKIEAFLEGAKARIVEEVQGFNSAEQMQRYFTTNAKKYEALSAVVGPEQVAELQRQIGTYVDAQRMRKLAQQSMPGFHVADHTPSLLDTVVGASGVKSLMGGGGVTPGQANAMRRVSTAGTTSAGDLAGLGGISDLLTASSGKEAASAANNLNKMINPGGQALGSGIRAAAPGVAVGSAAAVGGGSAQPAPPPGGLSIEDLIQQQMSPN